MGAPVDLEAAGAREDPFPPIAVVGVPADGFADAVFEGDLRFEAELVFGLGGVDEITAVVVWAVGYEFDVGIEIEAEFVADNLDHPQVRHFLAGREVEDREQSGCRSRFFRHREFALAVDDQVDAAAVVPHVEPIALLQPIAIERYFFTSQKVGDGERDQLFGKLVRAIVVGAMRHRNIHFGIGLHISANDEIGRGFRG